MKVTLAAPPVRDMYFSPGRGSTLGMLTMAKLLEREGASISVFNCPAENPAGFSIPTLKETDHLKPFIIQGERGPLSFFTGYRQFGPPFETCAERIARGRPDLVLISCFAWAYAEDTIELVKALRREGCRVPVGAGGGGVSAFPEYFLTMGLDFVITGEGEGTAAPLMKEMQKNSPDFSNIPNCFTRVSETVIPPDTFYRAESKDMEFVWSITGETKKRRYISTSLSRGCPRRCRFCSNFLTHGREFRKVPVEKVLEGVKKIPADKHTVINFEDDNLSFDPEYLFRVLEIFTSSLPEVSFMAENGIDYSFLDGEIVNKLAASGFGQFNLSLGTAGYLSAESENRYISLQKYEKVLEAAERSDIPVVTYFICGLEKDTPRSIAGILKYLHTLPTYTGISPFYPVPGLPGYTDKKVFLRHTPSLCRGASFYPWNGTLTTAEMITAFRISRFSNLKQSGAEGENEIKLVNRIETSGQLHTLVRKNKGNRIIPVPRMDKDMTDTFFNP